MLAVSVHVLSQAGRTPCSRWLEAGQWIWFLRKKLSNPQSATDMASEGQQEFLLAISLPPDPEVASDKSYESSDMENAPAQNGFWLELLLVQIGSTTEISDFIKSLLNNVPGVSYWSNCIFMCLMHTMEAMITWDIAAMITWDIAAYYWLCVHSRTLSIVVNRLLLHCLPAGRRCGVAWRRWVDR